MTCTEFNKNRQFIQSIAKHHYNEIEKLCDGRECAQASANNHFMPKFLTMEINKTMDAFSSTKYNRRVCACLIVN